MPIGLLGPLAASLAGGGGATAAGLSGGLGGLLGPVGGLLGGFFGNAALGDAQDFIKKQSEFNPLDFSGPGGSARFSADSASFDLSPQQRALGAILGQQSGGLLAGGLFNDPRLQAALGGNDIAGALGQANNALGQQAQGFFGQGALQGLAGQAGGLAGLLGGRVAAGPQDFSGGLQSGLFGQGAANFAAAGNQSGLFDQFLNTQRQAAQPQFNRQIQDLENRLFSQGRLGSTGGAEALRGVFEAQNQADLGFQNNAFGLAQNQQGFLAGLGGQQIGLGSQLLGQNLGQFNQDISGLQGALGLGAGIEGQGFSQNLSALRQNQSAGLSRLQAAQGLFGLGSDTFASQFGLGLGGFGQTLDQGRFGLENILGLGNLEANRINAFSQSGNALASLAESQSGLLGGFLGGLF